MRRITSLIMIAALLSVTSLPLLPQAKVCHAAEHNADCDTCHTDPQAPMEMGHRMQPEEHDSGMHHSMQTNHQHGMQMQQSAAGKKTQQMHKHQKRLTTAEKECRIECGCGCNHSVDGFPHLLAPHLASIIKFESGEQIARTEPELFPALQSLELSNPPPPPKSI